MTKSLWQASLRAPDGSVTSETFKGERSDQKACEKAGAWLMLKALPRMLSQSDGSGMDVTSNAYNRFVDALLSQDGEIVAYCDPWEMRLEHYTAADLEQLEEARRPAHAA